MLVLYEKNERGGGLTVLSAVTSPPYGRKRGYEVMKEKIRA